MNVQSLRDQSRQRTSFGAQVVLPKAAQPVKHLGGFDAGLQGQHASSSRVAQASPKPKPTTSGQPTSKAGAKRSR